MTLDYHTIGKRIKRRRNQCQMTQEKLAELCNVSEQYISNIERAVSIPSTEVIMRLAAILDTTPDEFLVGTIRREGGEAWKNTAELLRGMEGRRLELAQSFLTWLREQENF
ncbi:helix-turn-helix domain-containing protein [Lawsonibacter celer]|uniref:helix-turn-helix domain-containing protein n=1 Tax=Lawsonibacter celer TaxID=2986526 RepID=UPI0016471288|nr:helix-turn-helix transcriptional regulator [Lawsonibacter celer]